jgi:hypothetical protein
MYNYVASYLLQKGIKVGAINIVKGTGMKARHSLSEFFVNSATGPVKTYLTNKSLTSVLGQPLGNTHSHEAIHALDLNGKYSAVNSAGRCLL